MGDKTKMVLGYNEIVLMFELLLETHYESSIVMGNN